ncbi:MAG: metal-dependent hydrolase [Xanthomonadales bacterium]|nr:metal-dependent hydrolase [Xanthomonadales bacterium]
MDSLSQIVLGAACCGAVAPRLGRRALVYGAVLGTLPDLDVLLLGGLDPVRQFTEHRSFSHSLFVLTLVAPLLGWIIRRLDSRVAAIEPARWLLATWLALVTHPLLDAFTVYGTQLWWPLSPPPTMWASMFIIDPLYTLPFAVLLMLAWRRAREAVAMQRLLLVGLALSSVYLGWSLAAQQLAVRRAESALIASGHGHAGLLVSPAPFTTLMWRAVAVDEDGDGEAWISLRPGAPAPQWRWQPQSTALREAAAQTPPGQRLAWFTHGYYRAYSEHDRLHVADLRMGAEGDYFFVFEIGQREGMLWRAHTPRAVAQPRPRLDRLGDIYAQF